MKRREARENAFILIFGMEFSDYTAEQIIEYSQVSREIVFDEYTKKLVTKTYENKLFIDEKISSYLNNWKIGRIPRTTLAILRLAVCEFEEFEDIPIKVTINEAVELAKAYSTQEDAAYINGVLGSYVKENELNKLAEEE